MCDVSHLRGRQRVRMGLGGVFEVAWPVAAQPVRPMDASRQRLKTATPSFTVAAMPLRCLRLLSALLSALLSITVPTLAIAAVGVQAAPPTPLLSTPLVPQPLTTDQAVVDAIAAFYTKHEFQVPMRDGVLLHTTVYVPKDESRRWPFLMTRTPYGVPPYGVDNLPDASNHRRLTRFAPSFALIQLGYIFVHQDVRGRMMSQGTFVDVRPLLKRPLTSDVVKDATGVDEGTDTWDTIEWLLHNIPGHNGRVGVWGISYPGRYAAEAAVSAHPAIRAVSPQAPVTDWFVGDDFHHNGALCLADAFSFYANFGRPRPTPTPTPKWDFEPDHADVYDFYLAMGPLKNANRRYLHDDIAFWNELMAHENRDAFWLARDPTPHFTGIKPAVLVVGGWYDAEDLWGSLRTYQAMNSQTPKNRVTLVMGPWAHGGWARSDGDSLGGVSFGHKTSHHYREQIEAPFFESHLKGSGSFAPAEAEMFVTGLNQWRTFDTWPPQQVKPMTLSLADDGVLSTTKPTSTTTRSWFADPAHPVPWMEGQYPELDHDYMLKDQRFASRRPDVVTFQSPVLDEDVVVAGPVTVDFLVATDGTDLDVVVKLIDVMPDNATTTTTTTAVAPAGQLRGGAQQLVRGEIMRGRFRDDFAVPRAFVPGQAERVRFTLPDVLHGFRRGHRLMIQVQASWFPLFDRNPQTFVPIHTADDADFVAHTHTLHLGPTGSTITLPVLTRTRP